MAREDGVFIAVGSNIAPERHIPHALDRLHAAAPILAVSTFYWTAPLQRPEQDPYLNGVVQVCAQHDAHHLKFDVLRRIEQDLGRRRTQDRCAAREIDLDIILYGRAVSDAPGLRLPDPEIRRRAFLAVPLLELAPQLTLPDTGEPLHAIAAALDASGLKPAQPFSATLRTRRLS